MSWSRPIARIFGVVCAGLFLLGYGGRWAGQFYQNVGLLWLNRAVRLVSAESQDASALTQALVALERAEIWRPHPLTSRALSLAYTLQPDSSRARDAWQRAGANPADALLQGDLATQRGDTAAARAWYETAAQTPNTQAEAWYRLGQLALAHSDQSAARVAYTEAWRVDPELAAKALATLLLDQGDDAAVADILTTTLAAVPDSYHRLWWQRTLIQSLVNQHKWLEAATACRAAIQEFPTIPQLYTDLGWIYYERDGDVAAAREQFQQAIAVAPTRGVGEFEMGQLSRRERLYAEADNWYQQALVKNPYPYWFLARATLARTTQNLTLALDIAQTTVARYPDYVPMYYELAVDYYQTGDLAQARQTLEAYRQRISSLDAAYYVLSGQIYEAAGQLAQAVTAYQQALAQQPEQSAALAALARLLPAGAESPQTISP